MHRPNSDQVSKLSFCLIESEINYAIDGCLDVLVNPFTVKAAYDSDNCS